MTRLAEFDARIMGRSRLVEAREGLLDTILSIRPKVGDFTEGKESL